MYNISKYACTTYQIIRNALIYAVSLHMKQTQKTKAMKMKATKLENRTITTGAKTFEEFKVQQSHNYSGMPAKFRNAFMLRDWNKINDPNYYN